MLSCRGWWDEGVGEGDWLGLGCVEYSSIYVQYSSFFYVPHHKFTATTSCCVDGWLSHDSYLRYPFTVQLHKTWQRSQKLVLARHRKCRHKHQACT
jgi:hypothetical protein